LVFYDADRKGVAINTVVFVCKVDSAVRWNVAEKDLESREVWGWTV
jgi:hypothetical protein